MSEPRVERPRGLSREGLEALLETLHQDRDRAGSRYEVIRQKLVTYFAWRGAPAPEDMADETIDRVSRRIAGGERIRSAEPGRYFLAVARNVLREAWQRARRRGLHEEIAVCEGGPSVRWPGGEPAADVRLACLERCLAALSSKGRDLLLRYYDTEPRAKATNRRELAAGLGISVIALRVRVHRMRERVGACLRGCLAGHQEALSGTPAAPAALRPAAARGKRRRPRTRTRRTAARTGGSTPSG